MKRITMFFMTLTTFAGMYAQNPHKSELVSLNGIDVYYEVYGKGEPLFLLHGFTQSSKSWQPFVADYIDAYEVYLIDLKGHGKSSQFGTDEMKSIQARILFVLGDHDSVPLECISHARKHLPNSALWILPDTGHSAHRDKNKSEFIRRSREFLSQG